MPCTAAQTDDLPRVSSFAVTDAIGSAPEFWPPLSLPELLQHEQLFFFCYYWLFVTLECQTENRVFVGVLIFAVYPASRSAWGKHASPHEHAEGPSSELEILKPPARVSPRLVRVLRMGG